MRKLVLILLGCLLVLPAAAAGTPDRNAGDGALSVDDGRGQVTLQARGAVIGRFDRGCVTIADLTPDDLNFPWVWGDDLPPVETPRGTRYCGQAVRFRLIGGRFRIVVAGLGIDLSAVGIGDGTIVADDPRQPGVYSLEGDDCRSPRAACRPLPVELQRFKLGSPATPDKNEKSTQRVGS